MGNIYDSFGINANSVADKALFWCENKQIFASIYNAICNKNTLQFDAKYDAKSNAFYLFFNAFFITICNTICNKKGIKLHTKQRHS